MLESLMAYKPPLKVLFDLDFSKYSLGTTSFTDDATGRVLNRSTASNIGQLEDHATLGRSFYFNGVGGFILPGAPPDIKNKDVTITAEVFAQDTAARTVAYTGIWSQIRVYGFSLLTNIAGGYGDMLWLDGTPDYRRLHYGVAAKTGARKLKGTVSSTTNCHFYIDQLAPPASASCPPTSVGNGNALYIGLLGPGHDNIYAPFRGWMKNLKIELT